MTATVALDGLAAEARAFLAEHWDLIAAAGAADSHDVRMPAPEAAALSVCRVGPPEEGTGFATDDQLRRAERVVSAWVEIRSVARGDDPTAVFAAGVLDLASLCAVVARFLAVRPDGLIDDAIDLARGAVDLDRQAW